tara:strand:- start:1180 stop:1377 length:198 start_codon:yes stop_codon:yes gene_type:complete
MGHAYKKLTRETFTCYMCKKYYLAGHRYMYKTFELTELRPSKEFIICQKCAKREGGKKWEKNLEK